MDDVQYVNTSYETFDTDFSGFYPQKNNEYAHECNVRQILDIKLNSENMTPSKTARAYISYIHDRNIVTSSFESVSSLFRPKDTHNPSDISKFFTEQQNITLDNRGYINSKATLKSKVVSYLVGSLVSGLSEAAFNIYLLIKNALCLTSMILTGPILSICFKKLGLNTKNLGNGFLNDTTKLIKDMGTNINQIARNILRAIPVAGHFLGEGYDKLQTALIDTVERAIKGVKSHGCCPKGIEVA